MSRQEGSIFKRKRILMIIPDGVGIRNFVFSSFIQEMKDLEMDLFCLNLTPIELSNYGIKEIKVNKLKVSSIADLLKASLIKARLIYYSKVFKDEIYLRYIFPSDGSSIKGIIRSAIIEVISKLGANTLVISCLERSMQWWTKKGTTYKELKKILHNVQPDFVFCTNQRPIKALAALLAAEDLGIKTGIFIFSWDNLPKATLVLRANSYFIWSDLMQVELLKYYNGINRDQIFITGTPQFEAHCKRAFLLDREVFFESNSLDLRRTYICYSGDDITTSPFDQDYLRDFALAVNKLNSEGYNLGILFRPSPVDRSNRYDEVLNEYRDIITKIAPIWNQPGESWDTVVPTADDINLLVNTIHHTALVVNIASSMVFDFELFEKPCIYLNYTLSGKENDAWRVQDIYRFVHFKSMPSSSCVYWVNAKEELTSVIKKSLSDDATQVIYNAKRWRELVLGPSAENAAASIARGIATVIEQ